MNNQDLNSGVFVASQFTHAERDRRYKVKQNERDCKGCSGALLLAIVSAVCLILIGA